MNSEERLKIIKKIFEEEVCPTLFKKGEDYTGHSGKGANSNFDEISALLELDKYIIWSVFYFKHVQALLTWLRKRNLKDESIKSRLLDLINYTFIMWTMLLEDAKN